MHEQIGASSEGKDPVEKKQKLVNDPLSRTYLYFREVESNMRGRANLEDQFADLKTQVTVGFTLWPEAELSNELSHRSKHRETGSVRAAITCLSLL